MRVLPVAEIADPLDGDRQAVGNLALAFEPGHDRGIVCRGAKERFTSEIESAYSLPVHDLFDIRTNADTLTEDDWAFIKAAYDEEIASIDAQFARLMEGLEEQGRLDSTIVIVTGTVTTPPCWSSIWIV